MEWINSNDIKNWADTRGGQEKLPLLIRKLIIASCKDISLINFPSGNDISLGGWDGMLESDDKTYFIPKGKSCWELGSDKVVKSKAESDYIKRTTDKNINFKNRITFIFVTPRVWQKSDDWVKEKKREKVWRDVKVITVEQLTQLINDNPSVSSWLALEIGKFTLGVQSPENFWKVWSESPNWKLPPELLVGSRENQKQKIISLYNKPNLIFIEGVSKKELIGFIISCFLTSKECKEYFFAKCIIVDNEESFRTLSLIKTPLIIIPTFENPEILNNAVLCGHTIIAPIIENTNQPNTIRIPKINKPMMRDNLLRIGLSEVLSKKYAQESLGNITVLRRLLNFPRENPEWSKDENYSDILPALLVGSWINDYEGDKEIISKISRLNYDEYIRKLSKWQFKPDSPIIRIGNVWKLNSRLDSWINLSKYLIDADFKIIEEIFIEVLSEIDPSLDKEDENGVLFFKPGKYSKNIKEGISQSLIIISTLSNEFNLSKSNPNLWVDDIVYKVLNKNDIKFWKSLDKILPLIAEASPNSFLEIVEIFIDVDNSPIRALFNEKKGIITSTSYNTGLLWALECIAWDSEYISRVSILLLKLSSIDPGGNLTNRPINSLLEIFKPWHYQTLTDFNDRIEVLKNLSRSDFKMAKKLLIGLLPNFNNSIAHGTYKPKWKYFYENTDIKYNYPELDKTHSQIIDILLSMFDNSEEMLNEFIELSEKKVLFGRKKIIDFIKENIDNVKQINYSSWHKLRNILYRHRSYNDAKWAFSEKELIVYKEFYNKLMPSDDIILNAWKFDNRPEFIEGYKYESGNYEIHAKYVFDKRKEALDYLYGKYGLEKVYELIELVECPYTLGDILANTINDEKEILKICELFNEEGSRLTFAQNFIRRKKMIIGNEFAFELLNKISTYSINAKVNFLLSFYQEKDVLNFIDELEKDIIKEYWGKVNVRLFFQDSIEYLEYCIDKLIKYKRFSSALKICYNNIKTIPSNKIIITLEKLMIEKSEEPINIDYYEIGEIFDELEKRSDIERTIVIKLEWYYIDFLSDGLYNKQMLIHKQMSEEPEFFINIIKLFYIPEKKNEKKEINENEKALALQAYKVLFSWKTVPGIDVNNNINERDLNYWVQTVRDEAKKCGILDIVDSYIGKVLAHSPKIEDEQWPPIIICEIIEKIKNKEIKSSFSCELFNMQGMTTRSPFDGGLIEKNRYDYYKKIADNCKTKYPFVSSIFIELANNYLGRATIEDDVAELNRLEYE